MKKSLKNLYGRLKLLGLDPRRAVATLRGMPGYLRDLRAFRRLHAASAGDFPITRLAPCLGDRGKSSGSVDSHYFWQDLTVARRIFENAPDRHVDVGSRIDGFVAHVASFRQIEVLDIRPLNIDCGNILFRRTDIMAGPDHSLFDYCDSLSCLHALEHFGLGRYGDPLMPDGHERGFRNMAGILKKGGKFYLSVPFGPQRIEFNANRVFSLSYLGAMVAPAFSIDVFSYVDDAGGFHYNAALNDEALSNNCGCRYGCAILEMTKL